MRKILFLFIFTCALGASAQNIAINTDLVMDAAAAPSFGVEMGVSRRSTIGANVVYSPRPLWKEGHAFLVQPEYRFYFSGKPMYRHFIGLVGMYGDYSFLFGNRHYEGNVSGVGVSFGYVWNIGSRLTIDFHSSLGAGFFHHKEWDAVDGEDNYKTVSERDLGYVPANNHGTVCMPMRLGISVCYLLK